MSFFDKCFCQFQAVEQLKAGVLAVEAVAAALVELEVSYVLIVLKISYLS